MAQLIADRFLELQPGVTIDSATTESVDLIIDRAGSRSDQQSWADACASSLVDPRSCLVDFGFLGRDRRFAASLRKLRAPFQPFDTSSYAIEWLEHSNPASSGIIGITQDMLTGALPRELRLRGFIPLNLAMLERFDAAVLSNALSGRSVVILQDEPGSTRLALGFLKLCSMNARSTWAIFGTPRFGAQASRSSRGTHAAEGRAVFGGDANRHRFTLRAGSSMIDARAVGMLDEARRVMARGRHAAAERSLRASLAAFERRNDVFHSGDAAVYLGQLLQQRGRAADAYDLFARARESYEKLGAAAMAVHACAYAGLVQTDRAMFREAEDILRAAYSAASAIPDANPANLRLITGVALARCLLWQSRFGDASQLLEKVTPDDTVTDAARYWCLFARLRVAANDLPGAWSAVARARRTIGANPDSACESTVRTGEALVQAHLGDVDALECHVRQGLRAAAQAHLPLQAVRLRLTLLEGLLLAKRAGRARDIGARLKTLSKVVLPPLLAKRLAHALDGLATPSAHETPAVFYSAANPASHHQDVDGLTELLSHCHDIDDEREALARAALTIRKQTGALAVGIFADAGTGAAPLAIAGTASHVMAQRCIALGQPIGVERIAGGFEAATPVRYLSRIIGSIACRWSVDGPANSDRTSAFCSAAAAACAPLVYTLLERNATPAAVTSKSTVELVGVSAAIEDVRRAVARAAKAPFTVLIEGESGSGKELVARAIHQTGCRRERRFCPLNCAAMPEDLVDTELFGHAKGAFTGAAVERVGLFESADQGTVFLDEVGELSLRAQAKLLRVLQENEIRRIGETFTRPIDARLIAATNRSLRAEVDAGRFRQDLLYRLDVIRIAVPPLRERVEDIPLLAARFWRQTADRIGSKAVLGPGALSALARYDWPGNVRELQNVLTGMIVAVPGRGVVGASHMPAAIAHATKAVALETLDMARLRFEQRFVRAALAKTAGHRGQAAAVLGLSRQGLAKLMQRLGIDA